MEVHVCAVADFGRGTRRLIKAGLRNIAVYNVKGHYYGIDNACYHHGGPLLNGDIEDLGGHPCVKCPWHSYKITLDTGEGLYWGVDVDGSSQPRPTLKSKGAKQRTHQVYARGTEVYCYVDPSSGTYESDTYAEMSIANREEATPTNSGGISGRGGGDRIHSSLNNIVDGNRSGALLGGSKFTVTHSTGKGSDWSRTNSTGKSRVRIISVTPACEDGITATFTFDRASIGDRRTVEPGMWVKLRLPITDTDTIDRQWTVTHVRGTHGGWFSCTVKRRDDGQGGSAWLHSPVATTRDLEVIDFGGAFTLKALSSRIHSSHAGSGRLLCLTAGIGLTPIYASITAHATDPFATISGPPLSVVHIHSERHLAQMAFADELGQLHGMYGGGSPGRDPFVYQLQVLVSGPMPAAPTRTTQVLGTAPVTPGRLTMDIIKAALRALCDAGEKPATAAVQVMLCGPEEYMAQAETLCIACGVDAASIAKESF
jgi:ferredoxin-NADP reductase/nitrite reductase/ring-hydroxylating ferredoxin subunit